MNFNISRIRKRVLMDVGSDKIIKDFLRGLKVALSNAAVYAEGHSVVLKSIEDCKQKTDVILASFQNLEMFIGPRFLVINSQKKENDPLYEDIAKFFHHRSVKRVSFDRGLTVEELARFIPKAGLRPKDLVKLGGLGAALQDQDLLHIQVEMLDYSQILRSGKEDKDIWAFLLKDAIKKEDLKEIESIVNYFNQMASDISIFELLQSDELYKSIKDFLEYLRMNNKFAFSKCTRELFQAFLRNTIIDKDFKAPEKIKSFFETLNNNDYSEIFLQQILNEETPELSFFDLFSELVDDQRHNAIALSLADKIKNQASPLINLQWIKQVEVLFGESDKQIIDDVYNGAFLKATEGLSLEDVFLFDKKQVRKNYRGVLINLLSTESDEKWAAIVVNRVLEEGFAIEDVEIKENYYRDVFKVTEDCHRKALPIDKVFTKIDRHIAEFVESILLDERPLLHQDYFLEAVKSSSLGAEKYIEKIFNEQKVSPAIMRLFVKFFPYEMPRFCTHIREKMEDSKLLLKVKESIGGLDTAVALDILKIIYGSKNVYVRAEVLEMMTTLPLYDREFLSSIVEARGEDIALKEKALLMLLSNSLVKKATLRKLFNVPDQFGKFNDVLNHNMALVGRIRLKEAQEYLVAVSRRKFPWNKAVRQKAIEVLEQIKNG